MKCKEEINNAQIDSKKEKHSASLQFEASLSAFTHRKKHEAVHSRLTVGRDEFCLDTTAVIEHVLHVCGCLVDHELWNGAAHPLHHRELLEVPVL